MATQHIAIKNAILIAFILHNRDQKSSSPTLPPPSMSTNMGTLNEALAKYFSMVQLTMDEQARFLSIHHSDDIIRAAAFQSEGPADNFFLSAVGVAGIHVDIIRNEHLDSFSPRLTGSIGNLLRYAKAICDTLGLEVQSFSPLAFVLGALRHMCTIGSKNRELFLTLADRFEELTKRLSREDVYLEKAPMTDAEKTSLISALVDIILFCGLVTKYLEGSYVSWRTQRLMRLENSSPRPGRTENDNFDFFLRDLEWIQVDENSNDSEDEREKMFSSRDSLIQTGSGDDVGPEKPTIDTSLQIATDTPAFQSTSGYIDGAGRWFLNSPHFETWVAGHIVPHLWVRGLPASGKSIIAAAVVAALRQHYSAVHASFFCSERDREHPVGIIDYSNFGEPTRSTDSGCCRKTRSNASRRFIPYRNTSNPLATCGG